MTHLAGRLRVLAMSLALTTAAAGAFAQGTLHASPAATRFNGQVIRQLAPPTNNGTGFNGPQTITAPFGMQIVNAGTIVNTSTSTTTGVFTVGNPSVVFQFPITPDVNAYTATPGGLHFAYKSIGWLGTVAVEACLTTKELPAWPGATAAATSPTDAQTCPTEDELSDAKILNRAWYTVATARVDEYVVQNSTLIFVPTSIPLNIQQIVEPMRFHAVGYTLYYTAAHSGPNDFNAACPQNVCRDAQDLRTKPLKTIVLPAALIQLKVLPQTIVYLPPGNGSFASYKVTATYSTTLNAGNTTQVDNSVNNDEWFEDIDQNSISGTIGKVFSLGYSSSTDTRWDDKTTVKTGQALEHDLQHVNQQQIIINRTIKATATNVPGAAGTVANEPFWSDLVVMLIHPQLAVWDFYGKTTVQLIAASGASALPDEIAVPISELDSCASGTGPNPAGFPFTPANGVADILTASDCRALAVLDPFYGKGQSANVGARGQLFAATQPYGSPTGGGAPQTIDLQQIDSEQISITNQSTQTYAATAEDIVATTQSQGLKFGLTSGSLVPGLSLGFENDITLKQGSSTDTAQTMTLTYKNSSVTTNRVDVAVEGSINDTTPRASPPEVEVFLDTVYGGLMFIDPAAPVVPCKPQPACTEEIGNGGVGRVLAPRR